MAMAKRREYNANRALAMNTNLIKKVQSYYYYLCYFGEILKPFSPVRYC